MININWVITIYVESCIHMCTVRKLINTQLEQRVIIIRFSSQNIWTTNNIGTSIKLPTDVKLYKDQKLFLKPFGYKVMTIYNSQLPFHNLQKTSSSKRVHGNTTNLVWRLLVLNHSLTSSKIEVASTKLSAITITGSFTQEATKVFCLILINAVLLILGIMSSW